MKQRSRLSRLRKLSPRRKFNPDLHFVPGQRVLADMTRIGHHSGHSFSLPDRIRLRQLRDDLRRLWLPKAEAAITNWSRRAGINTDSLRVFADMSREAKDAFFREGEGFIAQIRQAMTAEARKRSPVIPATRDRILTVFALPRDADVPEIKRAYRRLAKTHHPDHGGSADTFVQIQRAYHVLLQSPPVPNSDR